MVLFLFSSTRNLQISILCLREEGENPEVYSLYFTYFLSDTGLVKRVDTFCLLESFTD